ncbi:MAG TPA: hypothetical protein VIO64_20665 [Pseudobacteroides sp.]|uniref:hypothetical protein n=1 Tax=Pseudobacteroides sp. TaxID=1968840 RepID=UPI002F93FE96
MNNNGFFNALLNLRSAAAFGVAVIATGVSYRFYNSPAGALLGGLIFLVVATYSVLFSEEKEPQKKEQDYNDFRELANESRDRLSPIIEKLGVVLGNIKLLDRGKYQFIAKFMSEIAVFEELIPNLVMSYRKGIRFLASRDAQATTDIKSLEMKLNSGVSESARQTYGKAISEKKQILSELKHIRNNLDDCESKLYYILSTLEKIETIIYSDELRDNISDETSKNINQQLEIFSGSVRDIAKVMKL